MGSAAAQNYEYNYLNQLEEITQGASTPTEFTYDQLGNTTKETAGNKTTNYEYNLLNQLTQLEKKTGNTVNLTEEYSYNPQGQRTARITDHHDVGGTDEFTRFYYMGSALLFTTTEGYLLQTENILDLGGQIIAGKRFENVLYSGKYFFYRYDVRGSVTNILGTDGGVVKNYEYDEFGNTTKGGDGSFKNDVTFTGSISDSASGLQYMNARYYNSSTGRFITQDTYTGSVTEPLTQHLYSYCSNNPINMVDPTGHDPVSILLLLLLALAAGATAVGCSAQQEREYIDLSPTPTPKATTAPTMGPTPTSTIPKERYKSLAADEELMLFIGTVAGESLGEGLTAWQAVSSVIMNRVKDSKYEFKSQNTITDVINAKYQFSGKDGPNARKIKDYIKSGEETNKTYDDLINTVYNVINGELPDNTQNSLWYYTPKRVKEPPQHVTKGLESNRYVEVFIDGIDKEDFRFFRGSK